MIYWQISYKNNSYLVTYKYLQGSKFSKSVCKEARKKVKVFYVERRFLYYNEEEIYNYNKEL